MRHIKAGGRLGGALAALCIAAGAAAQSLDARVRSILSDPKLGEARTGVVIMDAETGQVLAAHRADDSFIPASNMKLLTSGAALAVLGAGFVFETTLSYDASYRDEAQGPGAGAVTGGRIVLGGSGDPSLGDPRLLTGRKEGVESILTAWVNALKAAGAPEGAEVVIDDRVFDRQFVHPSWPAEQLNRWYCAEVAGVNFHANLLRIYATPQEPGRPPALKVEPHAPWVEVKNRARSTNQGSNTGWAARPTGDSITLFGDIRHANDPVEVALAEMPEFVGRLLADRMSRAGMRPARVRLATGDEPLAGGSVVHTIRTDMATILRRCNVDSHNLYAEALLKRMGHEVTRAPGSWTSGAAVMRMALQEKLGLDAGQAITVADGSGMSRNNRVTPRILARWLHAMVNSEPVAQPYLDSLPVAAAEGTLRRRFQGAPLRNDVRAKTGYLSGVSAISGFVTESESGRRLIFAIVTNDKPNRVRLTEVRQAEERIIRLVDQTVSPSQGLGAAGTR